MARWLLLALGLVLATPSADAQVFKPRGKAPAASKEKEKKAPAKKKKSAKHATAHKASHRTSTHKSRAARGKGRPDDLTPDGDRDDPDFVLITDDENIE